MGAMDIDPDKASAAGEAQFAEHQRWIWALGQVVYFFGQLESASVRILHRYSFDNLSSAKTLFFKPRTKIALDIMKARLSAPQHQELRERWVAFFESIIAAAEKRNEYLHNPLLVTFDQVGDGLDVDQGIESLRKPIGTPRIKLAEVEAFGVQLDALVEHMMLLLNETRRLDIAARSSGGLA
jgi:hypothetical protein